MTEHARKPASHSSTQFVTMWNWLNFLLALLVAVLWVFAIVRDHSLPSVCAGMAFALVFLFGWRIRGLWAIVWLALLAATFAAMVATNQDAAYLVFPLFFVILYVVSGWRAAVVVASFTAIAVVGIIMHSGFKSGAIIGPIVAGIIALVLGTGFQLLLQESAAREEAMADLLAARAEATKLAREAGESTERARVAADIHDTVAQGLTSIQLLLHSAEKRAQDPQLLETLRLARATASENLQETRRIIAALQPAPLTGASLPVALARICSTTPMREKVEFHVDGQPRDLPDEVEATTVRLAQSLLSNVVKHAQASAATVTLTYYPTEITLDVVDNGIGFDPKQERTSFGLGAAERRVAELNGSLEIESRPGAGCGIQVKLPVGQS